MHPAVRSLYKNFLHAARGYPHGMAEARRCLKAGFLAHADADVRDDATRKRLLSRGEFVLREVRALERLHRYRAMKKRYCS